MWYGSCMESNSLSDPRDIIAAAIADGACGCTGGCSKRPCEVDERSAEMILRALSDAGYTVQGGQPPRTLGAAYGSHS